MIRVSEMVLPGHPDKFCDQVADTIVAACHQIDEDAYCHVEVSVWSDQVWLSGRLVTRQPLQKSLTELVIETGIAIGYTGGNSVDATRYKVFDTVCQDVGDPTIWSKKVNDQCIVIGYAGYDRLTHYLPPEHFLAHVFREALTQSCRDGLLAGHGPDGKLLVRIRKDSAGWVLEHLVVTLQQRRDTGFLDLCGAIETTLRQVYWIVQNEDPRWQRTWAEVELLLNPNGPHFDGGSDGDNGQTGRKLVMDFYGPRVPIGGGALSGKHLTHIDRIAAYAAREVAVRAVISGAKECVVRAVYAPNKDEPLDVDYQFAGAGRREPAQFLAHTQMGFHYPSSVISRELAQGGHFYSDSLTWNGLQRRNRPLESC